MACSTRGPAPVTVGADDFALGDLIENLLPIPTGELVGDVEALISEVVELENQRIRLATVRARMAAEVLK
jgi:hypothetical protein